MASTPGDSPPATDSTPVPASNASPYVGPRPFERSDRDFFFGRDKESQRIVMRVISNRVFVLYAQSGAGKTSILNTQVIPMLEDKGFEVYEPARVSGILPSGLMIEQVKNIFMFNAIMHWCSRDANVARVAGLTLTDYLAEHQHPLNEEGTPKPRALIFDQFEELFTYYPQYWQRHADFFDQIKAALANDRYLWVIFSTREDYIAHLDNYASYFEDRLRGRLRLEKLERDSALEAVIGPMHKRGLEFAPDVAESIVDDLLQIRVLSLTGIPTTAAGEYVEPVQLQVACDSLWRNLRQGVQTITRENLAKFGGVDQALITFYEQSLRTAMRGSGFTESTLRRWFDRALITPMGTRGTVFRGPQETGGIPNKVVDSLLDQHLLRSEERAGARWYELAHDRFVAPVQNSNRLWRANRTQRQTRIAAAGVLIGLLLLLPILYLVYTIVASQGFAAGVAQSATDVSAAVALVKTNDEWEEQAQRFPWGEMVLVPPGCVILGSFDGDPDEQPVNVYCVSQSFWIDRYEVSNEAFQEAQPAPSLFSAAAPDASLPHTSITWSEADAFCRARGGTSRLPTEAEWEYAARGPDSLKYPWKGDFNRDNVNYADNSSGLPAKVTSHEGGMSWVGAMNMSGNVWEWTQTIYDPFVFPYPYLADGRDDEGNADKRVVRGGSFNTTQEGVRAANRYGSDPTIGTNEIGFRCIY